MYCSECKFNKAMRSAHCGTCGTKVFYCGLHQFRDCQAPTFLGAKCGQPLIYPPTCDDSSGTCLEEGAFSSFCVQCHRTYRFCRFHGLLACACGGSLSSGKFFGQTKKQLLDPGIFAVRAPSFVDRNFGADESDSDYVPSDDEDSRSFTKVRMGKLQKAPNEDEEIQTYKMFKPKGGKGFLERPGTFGPVKIKREKIKHDTLGTILRPVKVSGLVYPSTTAGRPGAPEPSTSIKVGIKWKEVGTARNTGIVDAQKGHIMALELGGPDIPENIVPQWANWQANGAWRKAEKEVLKMAEDVARKGHKCLFEVDIRYKPYPKPEAGSLKGVTFPVGFRIKVTEIDKSGTPLGSPKIPFDNEQAQDETDFKVSGMILDQADEMSASDGSDSD